MSGILKAVGKIFSPISHILPKKIGKIVRKVAMGVLMVGAVVMTGGAALGAFGAGGMAGLLGAGGLGLSAGLTTALTGAITTGAIGAVGGMLTGGFKGATKGFLLGAAAGGLMGATGLLGPSGAFGLGGGKAAAAASSLGSGAAAAEQTVGGLVYNASPTAAALGGSVPSTVSSVIPSLVETTTSAGTGATASGLGGMLKNPLLMSQLLTGVTSAFAPNEYKQKFGAEAEAARENSIFAFGGGDPDGKKKGFGNIPGVYSGRADPLGRGNYGAPPTGLDAPTYYQPRKMRWQWDPSTSRVVEVPA